MPSTTGVERELSAYDSSGDEGALRLFSWNINGIRAVLKRGDLQKLLETERPDALCLQEIKANPAQIDYDFPGYRAYWNPAKRAGYSGTAILVREGLAARVRQVKPEELAEAAIFAPREKDAGGVPTLLPATTNLAIDEGRVLILELPDFYLIDVYVPNSKRDLSRLTLRHKEWDPELLQLMRELERMKPVVICGDFNAAFTEMDLARPKANRHNAGFTDEERAGIGEIIGAGFIDTFRELHPEEQRYTWWSHMGHARANNVGWRIDYFFVSNGLRGRLSDAEIYEDVMGSDHCPVSVTLNVER